MAKAAVGLFENFDLAGEIVNDLEAGGFARNDIRVLSEPREMTGSGLMSIAHTDFEVDLVRELRSIGAAEADAEAYVRGVRRGGVIIFVTDSGEKAETAAEIMNRHCATEMEELNDSDLHLPGTEHHDTARGRNSFLQSGRTRSSGGGARLFVW